MKIQKIAVIFSILVLSSFAANSAAPSKSELEAMYDKAFREFDANHYAGALKALDAIDARQPGLAESQNLRGVILMRQGEYDKAETALRRALQIEPKFWNASFNLAEIPFMRKNWAEARNRFEALVAGNSEEMQGETNLLIQYKILLTFVAQDKEKMVDWILNKFEASKESSPALYYSNAAIALQHKNEKEAKEWIDSANKQFSRELNKLFAESFYEIGWLQKPAGEGRAALEITSTTERAERMKADAQANFEKAERAFQQRDFDGALKLLDLADEGVPNQPAFNNLRGEILMEQKKFDEAETALQKAFATDPKFREAQYNLAQIPFKKKDYATARTRLEALFAETPGDEKNQAAQLIKFKIFMTLLLENKDDMAQKMMDQFKFTGDTPALYYAQAAWAFKHGKADEGNDWIVSAKKIYSPALNIVFADSFYDVGWLTKPAETTPAVSALAQADASPPAEATPAMRFGQADLLPAPVNGENQIVNAATGTTPGPSIAASSPAPALAASAPPITVASTTKQPQSNPAATGAPKSGSAKQAAPPLVASKSAAPARALSQPIAANMNEQSATPRNLLVGGLLLAGVLLLVWLVVQQVRHQLPTVGVIRSSVPLTEPPFVGDSAMASDERKVSASLLAGGPPKLSLQLRASEPSVRKSVLTAGAIVAHAAAPKSDEPARVSPNEIEQPAAEPMPSRDEEEVSRAAAPEFSVPAIAPEISKEPEAEETSTVVTEPIELETADLDEPATAREFAPTAIEPEWELVSAKDKLVAQEKPFSPLTTAPANEPDLPELTQPEPKSAPLPTVPEIAAEAAVAGESAAYSSVETPSFASKIITTKPQSTTPVIMPESTTTQVPAVRAPSSTVAVQQPSGGLHTAVQLTFSLEIASMQLTPTFKMSGLQLKPMSKVVTMRLAPSQHPQPPMNLQVTFEIARIELADGGMSTIRLTPSAQEKPAVLSSSSFPISGLELVPGSGSAPVQLTPSHQEQASVHLTAAFQIAAIEFSPLFEIVAIVLNSTSKNVSMQLPGTGPSSIDGAPIFAIENVELGGNNELSTIQVNPLSSSGRRALT